MGAENNTKEEAWSRYRLAMDRALDCAAGGPYLCAGCFLSECCDDAPEFFKAEDAYMKILSEEGANG